MKYLTVLFKTVKVTEDTNEKDKTEKPSQIGGGSGDKTTKGREGLDQNKRAKLEKKSP